jgi:hypothetical protein
MAFNFTLPKKKDYPKKTYDEKTRYASVGGVPKKDDSTKGTEPEQTTNDIIRFDNIDELEVAFKKGSLNWPKQLEVHGLTYRFTKSSTGGIMEIFKGKRPGYIIYTVPQSHRKKVQEFNMGEWMVFLFTAQDSSKIAPRGIAFTTQARGEAMYEGEEVIGDIALLKISLPSGVIALKGKVDTGATISSLHVDSTPKIVGDTVKFENHNASGNVITAPLIAKQAVKSADGGTEYRPVIELDIEINGKSISKAQFNLNNRSAMEHEVLVGQNILEKGGFIVDPSQIKDSNTVEQEEIEDINTLSEEELDDIMNELSIFYEEHNTEE